MFADDLGNMVVESLELKNQYMLGYFNSEVMTSEFLTLSSSLDIVSISVPGAGRDYGNCRS